MVLKISKLTELFETTTERNQFTFIIVNKNELGINCVELDVFKG